MQLDYRKLPSNRLKHFPRVGVISLEWLYTVSLSGRNVLCRLTITRS